MAESSNKQAKREAAANRESVLLDDGKLLALMRDPSFREEFPQFKAAHQSLYVKKGCGGCASRKNRVSVKNLEVARRVVAALPLERKAALKKRLKAKSVVIKYRKASGSPVTKLRF